MSEQLEQIPEYWLKPKNDFVFKLIFGSDDDDSKELLLALLNDALDVPKGQSLAKLQILNPTLPKESIADKMAILDVKAKAIGYGFINVEIQLTNQKNIHRRSLYYASKLYEDQLEEGDDYRILTKVVAINLMDFVFFPSTAYQSCYRLKEDSSSDVLPDDLMTLHFYEMPKFISQDEEESIDPNDRMAKWLRFLTNTDDRRWMEMAKGEPIINKAVNKLRIASLDPEARMQYEAREKALKDMVSIREDGREDGREEGRLEGREDKALEVARKMFAKGFSIEDIQDFTGLSKEKVELLKAEQNHND